MFLDNITFSVIPVTHNESTGPILEFNNMSNIQYSTNNAEQNYNELQILIPSINNELTINDIIIYTYILNNLNI